MSTVCYCGQPDCPVTTWEHDACVANLRAERDALRAQLAEAHERLDEFGMRRNGQTATLEEGIDAMRGQLLDYQRWAYEAEGRESKLKTQFAEATDDGTLSARIGAVREALGMSEFDSAAEVGPINDLKAQLAEAVKVLRDLAEWGPLAESLDVSEFRVDCARADAVLAKVKL